ncbi:sugar transferase [Thalassospira sp. A3_1]|uniref:sugar transferase n=1 Tax=Thalassospira sp. A3_1 TaxID=2821088 RepID=UPI001ADC4394|nr:sugar transferase [Thalassospira sp. A3_1]MBO9506744.1 sugar transferase [Thalassospira sp. A3_1]
MQTVPLDKNPDTFRLERPKQQTKRLFDLSVGTILLFASLPVLLLIAIALKCDHRDPILFKQRRIGYLGRPFNIYKFRTLPDLAPDKLHLVPTKFCHFLRRWGLDELPQLFNVMRGDMSLVGPRPHTIDDDRKFASYSPRYDTRHQVKPGITGLAQLYGWRGSIQSAGDLKSRLDCDLLYIDQQSLTTDILILLRTISRPQCWVNGPRRTTTVALSRCNAG